MGSTSNASLRKPWIIDPVWDLLFLIGTPLLLVPVAMVLGKHLSPIDLSLMVVILVQAIIFPRSCELMGTGIFLGSTKFDYWSCLCYCCLPRQFTFTWDGVGLNWCFPCDHPGMRPCCCTGLCESTMLQKDRCLR